MLSDPESVTVLVVDDDLEFLDVVGDLIETWGYSVIRAGSPEDAVEQVRNDRGKNIKIMLTDHLMPGKNGIQLAREIKSMRPDIEVFMHSGGNYVELNLVAEAAGIKKVLEKGDYYWLRQEIDIARLLLP